MRKTIILLLTLGAAISADAQLKVKASGLTEASCIDIEQNGPYTIMPYGIYSSQNNMAANENIGIVSSLNAYTGDSGYVNRRAIGILGHAESAYKYNFGVYGCVPETAVTDRGAAIYGSNSLSYIDVGSLYAGFFDGKVKVTDNLMVDGYIMGTVLSIPYPLQPVSSILSTGGEDVPITKNLSALKPGVFYINQPQYEKIASTYNDKVQGEIGPQAMSEGAPHRKVSPNFTKRHYGIGVEELEEVFPDLVYENEDGTKSINYVEMVPILVQAINELKSEIDELKGNDGGSSKAKAQATGIDEMGENITMLALGQNKPNPFGTSTSIEVSVPADVQKAFIYVYDLTGKKLEQVDITSRGKLAVTIDATSLTDGMYLYSLIADGKVVETRRMIVEK